MSGGVIEDLTEDEMYVLAILLDHSGLDLAEWCWFDAETDDAWRAWPFQWTWFRDIHPLQIDQAARSVGKTTSIVLRMYAFPFVHPGQEAVITAPELVHLEPLTNLIERKFSETRLGREMLPRGRSSVTHRPFMMNFLNGSRIIGRIPQRDGKGIKGIHPLWLELDEAQDYPPDGWTELIETLKRGHAGAVWRAHGVTRGIRDKFYQYTQPTPTNRWKVHRFTAMSRPTWTAEEREEKIQQYQSRDNPDYRRNVLGLHGDATNPLFVLHRLMDVVDDDLSSDYNLAEYQHYRINAEMLVDRGQNQEPTEHLDFPQRHKVYTNTWAGMDVGLTNHPSEILIFGEHKKGTLTQLKLITRIHLERISSPQQARVIAWVMAFYNCRGFSMDKTGLGLPLFQELQEFAPDVAARIKGYGFSEKILVDFDEEAVAQMQEGDDDVKEAGIFRNVMEYCVDAETEALTQRGWMRHDELIEGELIYTLNTATGNGEWAPLDEVFVYTGIRPVRHLRTRTFDSVTTLNHRWWTSRCVPGEESRVREWRTTETLAGASAIPMSAPPATNPILAIHDDALVELVAWFWTEGCNIYGRKDWSGASLAQSNKVNPEYVERIHVALEKVFGPELAPAKGGAWRRSERSNGMVEWHLSKRAATLLRRYVLVPDKVVDPGFIAQLTTEQLRLFITVSLAADGHVGDSSRLTQSVEARLRSFEMACVLAGRAVHTQRSANKWDTTLGRRKNVTPVNATRDLRSGRNIDRFYEHDGIVWCPSTANGTFLARRGGCIYFTGNSQDKLRGLVDQDRIVLPWDTDLIGEFQGQTWSYSKEAMDMYGRRRRVFSQGSFHALDAARMAALGYMQHTLEEMMRLRNLKDEAPVLDAFVSLV